MGKNDLLAGEYVCFIVRNDHCIFMDSLYVVSFPPSQEMSPQLFLSINT